MTRPFNSLHVVMLAIALLLMGCPGHPTCSQNSDCKSAEICEPQYHLCVYPTDAGVKRADGGSSVGGGRGTANTGGGAVATGGGSSSTGGGLFGTGGGDTLGTGGGSPGTGGGDTLGTGGGSPGTGGGGTLSAPRGLSYSTNPAVYTKGVAITNNTPSSAGGTAASYSVIPTLPAGLTINSSTGVIVGVPTAITAPNTYTVTASNSAGSTSAELAITVNDAAPSGLSYSSSPAVYTKGVTISNNTPTSTGGAVVSYSVSPTLPTGLSFNTSTGVISGAPTAVATQTIYTVTATNSGGSSSVSMAITVNDVVPSALAYSTSPAVYTKGVTITNNTPTSFGGAVVSYSVSPSLPSGLSINTSTGVLSGTPAAVTAPAAYTITASNSGGSVTFALLITVNDVAPSTLTYSTNPATYTNWSAIANNTPSSAGGAVVSYSVSPALPAGLTLNPSTGVISGTPTALTAKATFTVTATNSGGSTSVGLAITVNDVAPSTLAYSTNPAAYTLGVASTNNLPSNEGGAAVAYSVSPALPAGLTLNPSTGVISGTPTALTAKATYTVTASNSGGTATVGLVISVKTDVVGTNDAIVAGSMHTCALVNGGVQCWGYNGYGQLGNKATGDAAVPGQVFSLSTGVQAISAGEFHTCALVSGGVRCWGYNGAGQLGDFSAGVIVRAPTQVQGLSSGVQAISAGRNHTCALVNGGVQCWGLNTKGQLGNNSTTTTDSPVQVQGLSSGVQAIASGAEHTCALVSGSVQCWGSQPGSPESHVPVQVPGLSSGVQAIVAGFYHSCALVNGGVQCWGYNEHGQLGNNSTANSSVPIQSLASGVQALTADFGHTCALVNGGAQCWGNNANGQLGNNAVVDSHVPTPVQGLSSGVQSLAVGVSHSCALMKGGVRCWGSNSNGQLGNNSTIESHVPVQVQFLSSGVQAVVAGAAHSCALVNAGVQCWGQNTKGQLGNNSNANSSLPVQVLSLSNGVQAIAAGTDGAHTCAVVNGSAKCWGSNSNGQLGDNSTTDSSVPVQVQGLTSGVQAIVAGRAHSCALVNGGVQCWGYGNHGALGNNTFNESHVPVQVVGLSGVQAIVAGNGHTCALVNGGMQCWGNNAYWQLASIGSHSPVPIIAGGLSSGVQSIAAGAFHTCAVVNGSAQCWGYDGFGELGINSTNDASTPVQVLGLASDIQAIIAGSYHTCAIMNGGVACWGNNENGELGNNSRSTSHVPVVVPSLSGGVLAVAGGGLHTCALVGDSVQCWGANANGQLGNNSTTDSSVPVRVLGLAL